MKDSEKQILLDAAGNAILDKNSHLSGHLKNKIFSEKKGVFVTLKKQGSLRGCIGFIEPVYLLGEAVIRAARAAAFSDPRFPPVERNEIPEIEIEISILSAPVLIKDIKGIKIGKDGLIIEQGYCKGLLLPQVFTEFNITSTEDALAMTCEKAGLSSTAWKDKKTRIYRFEAEIFRSQKNQVCKK